MLRVIFEIRKRKWGNMMHKVMTPGPVQVPERVRMARSLTTTNSDLDPVFYEEYKSLCEDISRLLHTKNETLILSGEGILGLEAACASLTEAKDRVLVLDNGIYGAGFADFVRMYGGNPVVLQSDDKNTFDISILKEYLEKDSDFKYATVVHCDTPSGVLNDVESICKLLHSYGILTVVDSVSGMFGNRLDVDAGKMDIVCGGSQKAVSAPAGLTFVVVSDRAKQAMRDRKTPIASFYCNLQVFEGYYEKQWFPYTMPISDIYGLKEAFELIKEEGEALYERHAKIANATREAILAAGLKNHLESGYSDTVTVFETPEGLKVEDILSRMQKEHGIMLAGSFGDLAGKVIRIGHMGANANESDMVATMAGLEETLSYLGYELRESLVAAFLKNLYKK